MKAMARTVSIFDAFVVAEAVDQHAARHRMKFVSVHVVAFEQVLPQSFIVAVQRRAACARVRTGDVLLDVVPGMEHQCRAALNANVADAEEQSASRFAGALDAKQFAAGIILPHDRQEIDHAPAFAEAKRCAFGESRRSDNCARAKE